MFRQRLLRKVFEIHILLILIREFNHQFGTFVQKDASQLSFASANIFSCTCLTESMITKLRIPLLRGRTLKLNSKINTSAVFVSFLGQTLAA